MQDLTPRQIVQQLDKYIIGQEAAKRAVAIALRNRYRRMQLEGEIRDEIIPKNILMIGTTGVGKTEIARRLANLAQAPFIKVEATKFTEVGYVGRDVDAIVRDLAEVAVRMVQSEKMAEVHEEAERHAEERILEMLAREARPASAQPSPPPLMFPLPGLPTPQAPPDTPEQQEEREKQERRAARVREFTKARLEAGELEDKPIEVEVEEGSSRNVQIFSGAGFEEVFFNIQDVMGSIMGRPKTRKRMTVREARELLRYEEAQKLIDNDEVTREAIERVEERGIVFLDELDKIAGREGGHGPDVSREGVQRDILPIVEGSTVLTKYGPVNTQHVLFIAAGAFHVSKPSDLIPELQGRFPLRVELDDLTEEDFKRILVEPRNSLVKQYTALMATENVQLEFTEDGIAAIAQAAARVNDQTENIGARRLHTVMERLLEDISFKAPEEGAGKLVVDAAFVQDGIGDLVEDRDLSRYIL